MPPVQTTAADDARRPADLYRRVRELLVRGRILPGSRVSEADLAARLGVSRTPVREAMRRLVTEGLLVADGGGARPRVAAAPVGAEDVEQLYQAVGAIEGVVARRIVDLEPRERRSLAAELRARDASFRRVARARSLDYDALFERHDAFHQTLREACASPSVRTLLDTLQPQLDRYEWLYAPLVGPDFRPTFDEHAAIIRALSAGSPAAAERAVRANWFNGGARLARALGEAGEIGASLVIRRAIAR